MKHLLKQADDLRWFVAHTNGLRGGYITDVQMSKKRMLDEDTGRDVLVGTTVTVVVRYCVNEMLCTARLIMNGVSDFSILEQEGDDCSAIGVIHAEASDERLRFWFDPEGRLYVVCEEASFEEIVSPAGDREIARAVTRWTFEADEGEVPTVEWLLGHLDRAGLPCIWRVGRLGRRHPSVRWEGELSSSSVLSEKAGPSVHVTVHRPAGSSGFGVTLCTPKSHHPHGGRVLGMVADLLARTFPGTCVAGETMLSCEEWLRGNQWESSRHRRGAAGSGLASNA
ncbi:MAG TPA: hypothetical protein VJ805_15000 [Nitrospiraceae bacterium]|nr:hypothetical protein [Nitrospiraceae bacterium]